MASRTEVVLDSRRIVEKYMQHKLAKCGHAPELVDGEGEEDEEEEEGREEERRVHGALREAGDELQRLYRADLTEMTGRLELEPEPEPGAARHSFTAVADELFRDGVNWGRIVAFLEFGSAVCVQRRRGAGGVTGDVARWMTEYLNGPVLKAWIRDNGGWVRLWGVFF